MAKICINISKIKLKEIMQKELIKIKANAPAGEAAKIMLKNRIHSLPIVNPENEDEILNMVTSYDLLGLTYYGRFSDNTDFINSTQILKLAEDQTLISLPPDATIKQAMDIIAEKGIRTIPIIDKGKIVGVVSITDIIRTILSSGKIVEEDDEN